MSGNSANNQVQPYQARYSAPRIEFDRTVLRCNIVLTRAPIRRLSGEVSSGTVVIAAGVSAVLGLPPPRRGAAALGRKFVAGESGMVLLLVLVRRVTLAGVAGTALV